MDILKMGKDELSSLQVGDVDRFLTPGEIEHMAKVLGTFWTYDYEAAADRRRVGLHALLKSGLHSDAFFVSRIFLALENIRRIISAQMVMRIKEEGIPEPDYVVGIPDGATMLGEDIAEMLGAKKAEMRKADGRISMVTSLPPESLILLVEDFCTRGTGFTEAVMSVKETSPDAHILRFNPVIINRGGLETISISGAGEFFIIPVVDRRVKDWDASECMLCAMGSKPIKPKATDENWLALINSQL
jgi:hypothetical protein